MTVELRSTGQPRRLSLQNQGHSQFGLFWLNQFYVDCDCDFVAYHPGAPFTPKSLRLIFVVADAPMRWLPHGSLIGGEGPSTSSTTSLVTP